jgi:hypothetical protein
MWLVFWTLSKLFCATRPVIQTSCYQRAHHSGFFLSCFHMKVETASLRHVDFLAKIIIHVCYGTTPPFYMWTQKCLKVSAWWTWRCWCSPVQLCLNCELETTHLSHEDSPVCLQLLRLCLLFQETYHLNVALERTHSCFDFFIGHIRDLQ